MKAKKLLVPNPTNHLKMMSARVSTHHVIIMCIVFNPQNPVGTIRNLTNMGSTEIIGSMLDKINMIVDGGQLI